MEKILSSLGDEPKLFPDCCVALSKPLIETLVGYISRSSLVFSIGAGSGLLERLLLEQGVNIHAVEVLSCPNLFLPEERMLRVLTSLALHSDATTAETLMFCYPRMRDLVEKYLRATGAMQQVVFISHRDEWDGERGYQSLFQTYFASVAEISLSTRGFPVLAEYEVLCVASSPVVR